MAGAFGAHALAPRLGEKAATWVRCVDRGFLEEGTMGSAEGGGQCTNIGKRLRREWRVSMRS